MVLRTSQEKCICIKTSPAIGKAKILIFSVSSWEYSLLCHIYRDTGHQFLRSPLRDIATFISLCRVHSRIQVLIRLCLGWSSYAQHIKRSYQLSYCNGSSIQCRKFNH